MRDMPLLRVTAASERDLGERVHRLTLVPGPGARTGDLDVGASVEPSARTVDGAIDRVMTSAIGERQMLPVQTKRMR